MPNDFDKFLEDLEKAPQPEAASEVATDPTPAAPVGPPDPYAHLIGHGGPIQEKSPFDAFLDDVTADAPEPEEKEPVYENHDWESVRKTLYEDDQDIWRCKRCFRQINVNRDETVASACARVNLNPNCGEQVAAEVMES